MVYGGRRRTRTPAKLMTPQFSRLVAAPMQLLYYPLLPTIGWTLTISSMLIPCPVFSITGNTIGGIGMPISPSIHDEGLRGHRFRLCSMSQMVAVDQWGGTGGGFGGPKQSSIIILLRSVHLQLPQIYLLVPRLLLMSFSSVLSSQVHYPRHLPETQ